MRSPPLVSVVLPVYNAEAFLGEAVRSILAQTLTDFELIIVDDASTDRSTEIALAFEDPRVRVLRQEVNGGYPVAMNMGLGVASGLYMARMDADDVAAPERLARQVGFLQQHGRYGFVGTRRYLLTPYGKRLDPPLADETHWEVTWKDLLAGRRAFADPSVVADMALVRRVGGYRTYQRSGQDVDLWLRLLETGRRGATLAEPLYGRRMLPTNITYAEGTLARNQVPRLLAEERCQTGADAVMQGRALPEPVEGSKEEAATWRVKAMWRAAYRCFAAGDYRGCLLYVKKATRVGKVRSANVRAAAKYGKRMLVYLLKRSDPSLA